MTKEQRAKIVKYLEQTLLKMRGLFSATYIQSLSELKDAIASGADFSWDNFKAQSQKIDKMIDSLLVKTNTLIIDSVSHTYQSGIQSAVSSITSKYEELKKKYTRKKDIREAATEASNIIKGGAEAATRTGEKFELSDRVWNLKDQVKDNITIQVKNAISMGLSPQQAQLFVTKYLNNPKLITMHVLDKDGNLVLSEEARKLHPGRGVYRDPLKNAERLLRTETMAAYRQAEIEQYQKTDLVIGYEIKLSGNHTTTDGKGGFKKLKDICDTLQGKYPKTFVWHGWHPNCRCVLMPLYVTDDKMDSYFEAKHNGALDDWNKNNQISDLPKNFNDWVKENSQRLKDAQNAKNKQFPQWIKDNELLKKNDVEQHVIKHKKTPQEAAKIQSEWEENRVNHAIDKAKAIGPKLNDICKQIAEKIGVNVSDINYKSKDSTLRKLRTDDGVEKVSDIKDLVRNTFITTGDKIELVIQQLSKKIKIIRRKNQAPKDFLGYSGCIINIEIDGVIGECQIVSPQIIYGKMPEKEARMFLGDNLYSKFKKQGIEGGLGHKFYEEYRILSAEEKESIIGKTIMQKSFDYYDRCRKLKF